MKEEKKEGVQNQGKTEFRYYLVTQGESFAIESR